MPLSKRIRITKSVVDKLEPSEIRWDNEVRGFGVRRQLAAKKYVLKTRVNGRQRWFTIGEHGSPWTPDTARKEAIRLLSEAHKGASVTEMRRGRSAQVAVKEMCERYLREHAIPHKKSRSVGEDRRNIKNHVIPLLGKKLVSEVTRADIDAFKLAVHEGKLAKKGVGHRTGFRGGAVVTGGPGVANRCLSLLSKMFNLAEVWDLRPDGSNPVRNVTKYKENQIERYLSTKEISRLAEVMGQYENDRSVNPYVIAALRLFLFTGARLNEILGLRWDQVDLDRSVLSLPDSKTGRKSVYLNSPAVDVLKAVPKIECNPYVIVGNKDGEHLVGIRKPWYRIREEAGIPDVRIHDLRHSFASVAVSGGLTLPLIGKLLGHKKSATTERYAHLADDPVKAANEQIGQLIENAISGR